MTIDEGIFSELKAAFDREFDRVRCYRTRRKLTSNVTLRLEYRTELTRTYNAVTRFLHRNHLDGTFNEKIECQNRQIKLKNKLKEAFEILKVYYEFESLSFSLVDINKVIENLNPNDIESETDNLQSDVTEENNDDTLTQNEVEFSSGGSETNSQSDVYESPSGIQSYSNDVSDEEDISESGDANEILKLNRTLSLSDLHKSPEKVIKTTRRLTQFLQREEIDNRMEEEVKMAFEYITNISRIIKNTFNGDSSEVDAFIASIELADSASNANNQENLVKYIRTKLTGPAVDYVPANTATAAAVVRLIREKVKGDNTQVVLGRLLALRTDKQSLQKFQEQAESLAEKLKKSYITDGIPHDLANKMTIDKTVEMCRLSARTPLVKSVLASSTFKQPKEVLAKFITEAAQESTEVKILAFRNNNNNNRGRNFQNNRGAYNNNRGNFQNFRGAYNNNRNQGYNNFNHGNGFRGRGRGGGYRGRGNGYRNNNNYNNGQNNGNRYVRAIQENGQAPPQERGNQQQVEVRQA